MSFIGKIKRKIKSKLLFHGGEPYSLEEIESMDEEELGRLFKDHYEGPYANRNMVDKVTKIEAISIFVVSILAGILCCIGLFKSITTNFDTYPTTITLGSILLFPLMFILPIAGGIFAYFYYDGFLITEDDWRVKWFFRIRDVLRKKYLFNNDIDISWCVRVQQGPNSKLGALHGLLKDVEGDRIHDKYTDEELGRLVKIVSPLIKFRSSGGKFNEDTYSILDEKLGVNSALREFQDSAKARRVAVKEEEANWEKLRNQMMRQSAIEKTREFAERTSTVLSDNASRKTVLDGSVEYNRIKDAANHVMETSDHLKGMITNEA